MQQRIQAITTMQMLMTGTDSLTPEELIVAALHSLNLQHKLECYDSQNQVCQFPLNWRNQGDGYYSFRYKNKAKSTFAKFRYSIEGNKVISVFGDEGSKETYRITIDSKESLEDIIKNYTFTLKQYLGKSTQTFTNQYHQNQPNKNLHSQGNQGREVLGVPRVQPSYPPKNLINQGNTQNPFGQEQYVGPNSSLFTQPSNQPQNINPLMIPPGARYDPVDPFDDPLIDRNQPNPPNDFIGFDEHGAPIGRPFQPKRGGFPSNPFQGGYRGGFGGGRGGFGGFGGGGFNGMI